MKKLRYIKALLVLLSIFAPLAATKAQADALPVYKNPKLPVEQRVNDLVSRMTLEEKILQMQNGAPAIARLGIPEYEWWNEGLHGVARAGIATVFPQAIGLAATFNEATVWQVADATSTEARAKHHEFARQGDRGRYKGLTIWTPNINIFRDPRWGRGQETWGEDPFLTGKLGTAFVKGLQGSDPKYLKTAATIKHFAVHSGPEPERHSFDAVSTERDLRETYLPAFRTAILDGKADGVMCAYNRVNGLPACASGTLLGEILRGEWRFKGHVVSDCAAIRDIYQGHKFLKTEGEASAEAVKKGTDLTCGKEYVSLKQAVRDRLITEAEIDTAVRRLMTTRFRLGMFDPAKMVKYAQIPYSVNDSPAHRRLARESARESLVLLRNENNALPLKKDLRTIAVIGPNADDRDVLLGNYNGQPSEFSTPLTAIQSKVSPNTRVLYSPGMYPTGVTHEPVGAEYLSSDGGSGLKGEYFNNRELTGAPALVRNDARLNFDWGALSPSKEINKDNFSARWTGKLTAPETGKYKFGWRGNGGVRILFDGKPLHEDLQNRRTREALKDVSLEAGKSYDVQIEYIENSNLDAMSKLVWTPPAADSKLREDALAKARQADAVVMVMGISARVEGEEMKVNLEGFRSGDRTELSLPKPQQDLIKEIHALGKPVVLVLMSGSALAVNWESENIPAILNAWYPGEEGGAAIADVLFGDYNPGGRLPVTFYKSAAELPPFEDYRMQGRTYRYFKAEPLYPFGYGLSYTKFAYGNLKMKNKIRAGENLQVSVEVRNAGSRAGSEVVQLYLTDSAASVPVPIRNLAGVTRVYLKPGEKRKIVFTLTPRQMSVFLDNGKRVIEPGDFAVSIGGKQPGFSGRADAATTGVASGTFSVVGEILEMTEK